MLATYYALTTNPFHIKLNLRQKCNNLMRTHYLNAKGYYYVYVQNGCCICDLHCYMVSTVDVLDNTNN